MPGRSVQLVLRRPGRRAGEDRAGQVVGRPRRHPSTRAAARSAFHVDTERIGTGKGDGGAPGGFDSASAKSVPDVECELSAGGDSAPSRATVVNGTTARAGGARAGRILPG